MSVFRNTKKRAARRAWPIHGYVGANGSGKSLCAVWDTLPTLEAGRPVLSTVRLLDYENPRACEGCDDPNHDRMLARDDRAGVVAIGQGDDLDGDAVDVGQVVERVGSPHRQAHPAYVRFTDWEQLLTAERCDVIMDEVTGVASSRESHSMPAPVANALVQMRRADVVIRWTAPSWARADKIIRECSQAVTYCRGYLPKRAVDESGERLWRNRRMFKWATYDAADFEDFTVGKRESLRAWQVDWHWGPRSEAFRAYDTFDAVSAIGTVTDSGRCYRCGGRRRVPECRCESHPDTGGQRGGAGVPSGVRADVASLRRVALASTAGGS